jgi:signal transduction histidine kinase
VLERLKPFFAPDWGAVRERLLALFNDRRAAELRLERHDGTILDCAAVPLPDGAMLLTWLDVTDTAKVERALRERNEALAAADLLKSEFIANVSAEVRRPLTTIIGFSEMLQAEYFGKLEPRQHDYAKGISEAGLALQTLVSDILDLAAIEAGQMTLELDTVEIHPMLGAVLSLVRERLRLRKLGLDFDCPLDIGWIVADERRLKQVMFNLIANAAKFTPAGGRIAVAAARQGGEVVLTVGDTGPGIRSGDQGKVFDAFMRGRQPAGEDGAGLGLTLVKRFVELHHGRVELTSKPGQGTTVTVRLPGDGG